MRKPTKNDERRLKEALASLEAIIAHDEETYAGPRIGAEQARYLDTWVAHRLRSFLEATKDRPRDDPQGLPCLVCNNGKRYLPRALAAHVSLLHGGGK